MVRESQNAELSPYAVAPCVAPDLRSIFDAAPLAIISYSLDRCVRAWNPMAERLFGWKAEEITGQVVPVPDSVQDQWFELQGQLIRGESFTNVETRRLRKDGSEFDVIVSGAPTYDSNGRVNGFIAVLGDAGQVLRIERALQTSEQRRLLALQAAEMGSWSWDIEKDIVEWDAECKVLFGVPDALSHLRFDSFLLLLHPDDRENTRDTVVRAVAQRKDYDMVHRVVWPNGEVHWVRCKGRLDSTSNPTCLIGVSINADWIKKNEELMRRNERLDSAAQLAFELSHEINNPLEILCNTLYLIQCELGEKHYAVEAATEAFGRVSAITQQLLALHARTGALEPVEVGSIADQVLKQFEARLRAMSIKVDKKFSSARTLTSAVNVRHIITRLIDNALDCLAAAGTISLRVHQGREWSRSESKGVRILVADNGPGISDELQKRLFGAFVSTKPNKGAGLGLWVCKTLAAKCGGSIRLRSSTAKGRSGTCVSVFIPEHEIDSLARHTAAGTRKPATLARETPATSAPTMHLAVSVK